MGATVEHVPALAQPHPWVRGVGGADVVGGGTRRDAAGAYLTVSVAVLLAAEYAVLPAYATVTV